MFFTPVEEGIVEADVMSGLFAFQPLVSEDFVTLYEELPVNRGLTRGVALAYLRNAHAIGSPARIFRTFTANRLSHRWSCMLMTDF